MTKFGYRPDIDGLRAIAVLSVLGFHFFPEYIPGGFVGVDIFFVISGFLITQTIISDLNEGKFSIYKFYQRRVRRIFPALILVLLITILIGWFVLLAHEYSQLNKHVVGGALFISNLLFWKESGYFDNSADTKPLLHLWSLGIEEQFYIIWPLLIFLGWKKKKWIFLLVLALWALSFAFGIYKISGNPVEVFYSPVSRFWELAAGGALALKCNELISCRPINNWAKYLSVSPNLLLMLGFILIIYSICIFDSRTPFPGAYALIPVVGAMLLIGFAPLAEVGRYILQNKLLVWIGIISFPLYLWHWPLYSFVRILGSKTPSIELRVWVISASFLLAYFTYRLIELPIKKIRSLKAIFLCLTGLMFLIACIGVFGYLYSGEITRKVDSQNTNLALGNDGGMPNYVKNCDNLGREINLEKSLFTCFVDTRSTPKFALVGDSKAGALIPGLFRTSGDGATWIFFGSGESGPLVPIISNSSIYQGYSKKSVAKTIENLQKMPEVDTVAISVATRALFRLNNDYSIADLPASKNYQSAKDGLAEFTRKVLSLNKNVILILDNPTLPHPEDCIQRETQSDILNKFIGTRNKECELSLSRHLELSKQYRDLISQVAAMNPERIEIFDTVSLLCDDRENICPVIMNGRPVYGISDHISDYTSGILGRKLNTSLSKSR